MRCCSVAVRHRGRPAAGILVLAALLTVLPASLAHAANEPAPVPATLAGPPPAAAGLLPADLTPPLELRLDPQWQEARRLKLSGQVLVGVAIPAYVAGTALWLDSFQACFFKVCSASKERELGPGIGLSLGGVAIGITGAILWVTGHRRLRRLLESLPVQPTLQSRHRGAVGGFVLRF
jgi:hypothetical protein